MRIAIITPLYPPDTAEVAAYTKELAQRLSTTHTVSIFTYGSYPEKLERVTIYSVSKRQPKLIRLMAFTFLLLRHLASMDHILMENGPSVEIPTGIALRLLRKRGLLHFGDIPAHIRASQSFFLSRSQKFLAGVSAKTLETLPPLKPEILPFTKYPSVAFSDYELGWTNHLRELRESFV